MSIADTLRPSALIDTDPTEVAIAAAVGRIGALPHAAEPMSAAIRSLCTRGGKRIRPRLCVLAFEGVAGSTAPDGVHTFAAGIELLHAFMLVHDDLIDSADMRRGGPSVQRMLEQAHIGNPSRTTRDLAMLAGDLLFALAVETMVGAPLPAARSRRALRAMLASARDAAVGEYLDVLYEGRRFESLTSAELAEVLRLKTARYTFEAPLLAGAILAGADPKTRTSLAAFGARVGVAFQLTDDLLDLFGDPEATGKPAGGDIRQGKRTVVLRLALDRASPQDAAFVLETLAAREHAKAAEIAAVANVVARSGAAAEIAARVRELVRAGGSALDRAAGLSPSTRGALRKLAAGVVRDIETVEARWS